MDPNFDTSDGKEALAIEPFLDDFLRKRCHNHRPSYRNCRLNCAAGAYYESTMTSSELPVALLGVPLEVCLYLSVTAANPTESKNARSLIGGMGANSHPKLDVFVHINSRPHLTQYAGGT
jgi:hypothetical protein